MTNFEYALLFGFIAIMAETAGITPAIRMAIKRVGGLTFVRLGRLSLSFCLTRN